MRDILPSARRRAERELEYSLSLLRATLDATADGILVIDAAGRIADHNQRFRDMWRLSDALLAAGVDAGALAGVLDQVKDPEQFLARVRVLQGDPDARCVDTIEFRDGRIFERHSIPQKVGGRTIGRVYSFRDVTARKQAEERLYHLAHHDTLTELPNRSLFLARLGQAIARARDDGSLVGVMFIDIDRLKATNDTLGHDVGDRLLRAVAERLSSSLRAGDTVARFGGDEFALILPDIGSARTAGNVAAKLLSMLAKPFVVDRQQTMYVSASIGITLCPGDGDTPEALIRNADIAMYRAKEHGGDTYQHFTPGSSAKTLHSLTLETELRQALMREEFRLQYQPRVDIASGRITGMEALLRWHSPRRGLLPPGEFVPLLEESSLIIPVGEWVLATACRQARAWELAGLPPVPIAVNVSARQFRRDNFAETVGRILRETELPPGRLELEITESAMMFETATDTPVFGELKELGVALSIDDFGTGYSSLNYLKRIDVDILKIDRSFIKDVTLDSDNDTITTAIVAMAHALGCKAIAEGVESRAQLYFLASRGCDEYQGYLFAQPLDAEDIVEVWRSRPAVVASVRKRRAAG